MKVEEIVSSLSHETNYNPDEVTITFREGLNMRGITKLIVESTNNKENDINYVNEHYKELIDEALRVKQIIQTYKSL